MDLFDDVLIIILSYLTKKNDIDCVSLTCQKFRRLMNVNIYHRSFKILSNFEQESLLFFEQGKTIISSLEFCELTQVYFQLWEINKQQHYLKKVLISLRCSQHQRLFQRCVKLFSNKEFNRYYQSDLKDFASIVDQKAVKECFQQVRDIMIDNFEYCAKLNQKPEGYADVLFAAMTSCKYPSQRFQEISQILIKRNYTGWDNFRIYERIFQMNLTTYQIEESLQSFEKNVFFGCFGSTTKTSMIANYLGETCQSDGLTVFELFQTFQIELCSQIIFVCTLFPIEHVRHILFHVPREWHKMLNGGNMYQLMQISEDAFDVIMVHYESSLKNYLSNELTFMKFLCLVPKMKIKWLKKYLTDENCLKQLFSLEPFPHKFYYFLKPEVIKICNQLENDSSPNFPIDQIALFNYLFDREIHEIDQFQLSLFIDCF
jgi:hypothetical protein